MNKTKLIKNLAVAAVRVGANVQPGEEVLIETTVQAAELAREVTKLCYEAGAKRVVVNFADDEISRLHFDNQSIETLTSKPAFAYDVRNYFAEHNGSLIAILCNDPNVLEHTDAGKLTESRRADMKGLMPYYEKAMSNSMKWTILAYPHPAWAKLMFPDLDGKDAVKKLGKYIAKTSRVDNDDPVAAWKKHSDNIHRRAALLNAADIESLHYKNKLGTDVVVGLPQNYVFAGGAEECNGVMFNPNIPSEEIFSAPDCNNINGVIKASMPLCYNGKIINDIAIKLKDGKIVDFDASTNKDVLKGIIETDDGSRSLGEVALVPYNSPISDLDTLFYETLFDENASCHFAIGKAYASCVKGGESMTKEQLCAAGVNDSNVHVDFMVGTKDLSITAKTKSGKTVNVFEHGNFAKDFE